LHRFTPHRSTPGSIRTASIRTASIRTASIGTGPMRTERGEPPVISTARTTGTLAAEILTVTALDRPRSRSRRESDRWSRWVDEERDGATERVA
jgi:hypothetical protein